MKLINKIKAFFMREQEPVELDLVAAEIREGKAFLHTKGEEPLTYMVRANDIEIRLNKDASVRAVDIMSVKKNDADKDKKLRQAIQKAEAQRKPDGRENQVPATVPDANEAGASGEIYDFERFKKRKFTISVYPEEYDMINAAIKEYGYKRADFVMACVNTATKGTMEKAHKKIIKSHRDIVLEQQELFAKQAREIEKNGGMTG